MKCILVTDDIIERNYGQKRKTSNTKDEKMKRYLALGNTMRSIVNTTSDTTCNTLAVNTSSDATSTTHDTDSILKETCTSGNKIHIRVCILSLDEI